MGRKIGESAERFEKIWGGAKKMAGNLGCGMSKRKIEKTEKQGGGVNHQY